MQINRETQKKKQTIEEKKNKNLVGEKFFWLEKL